MNYTEDSPLLSVVPESTDHCLEFGEPPHFFSQTHEYSFMAKLKQYVFAYNQVSTNVEGIAFYGGRCQKKFDLLLHIYHDFDGIIQNLIAVEGEDSPFYSYYIQCFKQCIFYTRDKRDGYGIRDISYVLLFVWHTYFPKDAMSIMKHFVLVLGSWADIKYYCEFCKDVMKEIGIEKHAFYTCIHQVLQIITEQLWSDSIVWNATFESYLENRRQFFLIPHSQPRKPLIPRPCARNLISFVSKWIPRENSKYGWLYDILVLQWGHKANWHGSSKYKKNHSLSPHNVHFYKLYKRKSGVVGEPNQPNPSMDNWRGKFRKVVSKLNRELDVVEIKMCANKLDEIHIPFIPKECFRKNMIGFLTGFGGALKKYNGGCEYFWDHFFEHSEDIHRYFLPEDFVRLAVVFSDEKNVIPRDFFRFLNFGWKTLLSASLLSSGSNEMIPVVEVLFDHNLENQYQSVADGILLAQKNIHRFILSNHFFNWVIATPEDDFTDIIDRILCFLKNPVGHGFETTVKMLHSISAEMGFVPKLFFIPHESS